MRSIDSLKCSFRIHAHCRAMPSLPLTAPSDHALHWDGHSNKSSSSSPHPASSSSKASRSSSSLIYDCETPRQAIFSVYLSLSLSLFKFKLSRAFSSTHHAELAVQTVWAVECWTLVPIRRVKHWKFFLGRSLLLLFVLASKMLQRLLVSKNWVGIVCLSDSALVHGSHLRENTCHYK